MSPKVNKPKLADDLRRLRAECTPIVDRSLDLLDFLYQRLAVPELPHLDLAWEPYVDSTLYDYMTTVGNRCQHAHGGDEPVAGKRDVLHAPPSVANTRRLTIAVCLVRRQGTCRRARRSAEVERANAPFRQPARGHRHGPPRPLP